MRSLSARNGGTRFFPQQVDSLASSPSPYFPAENLPPGRPTGSNSVARRQKRVQPADGARRRRVPRKWLSERRVSFVRPKAVRQASIPSRTVLVFESVVAHGGGDPAGVPSGTSRTAPSSTPQMAKKKAVQQGLNPAARPKGNPATTYSPTRTALQYHRRKEA